MDHAHQRGGPGPRAVLQPARERVEAGEYRGRPEGAGRHRGIRRARVRRARRRSQRGARDRVTRPSEGGAVSALESLLREAEAEADSASDLRQLDAVRVKYLGKKGLITDRLKALGRLPPEERRAAGKAINEAKDAVERVIGVKRDALEAAQLDAELAAQRLDVTLPERGELPGALHPVTRTLRRMTRILARAGFDVATGPEIEDDFHNFTALNIPDDH